MANDKIKDLGIGIGLLYITDTTGLSAGIISNLPNLASDVPQFLQDATFRAPLAGRIAAVGSLEVLTAVSGGADTMSQLNIAGVNQIPQLPATIVNGDTVATALNIRDSVEGAAPTTGGDYSAFVVGSTVFLTAPVELGDTVNGDAVTEFTSGASTFTLTNVDGGSDGSGIVDTTVGHRYFINANYDAGGNPGGATAVEGSLTNAIEITESVVSRGLQTKIDEVTATVSGLSTSITRLTAITSVNLAGAGAQTLSTFDTQTFSTGDKIQCRGAALANVITIDSAGNINLVDGLDWVSGISSLAIELELKDGDNGVGWYECNRTSPAFTVAGMRTLGIPEGVAGVKDIAVLAAGTTVNLVPGTDEAEVKVTSAPAVTLVGNVTITLDATGAISGDHFKIRYQADLTLGGNTITIGGISVPDYQATGGYNFDFVYNSTGGWSGEAYPDLTDVGTTKLDGDKINPGSVDVDQVSTDLKVESVHFRATFETGEQGEYRYYPGFKCDVVLVTSRVELALAAVDAGTVTFANNTGNMGGGVITHALSAAFGDEQVITPVSNTEILDTEPIKITTAKATAGGIVGMSIKLIRKE